MSEAPKRMLIEHQAVPFWRDVRVIRWAFQILILVLVVAFLFWIFNNLVTSLARIGLSLSFNFLTRIAGFSISEGPEFSSRSPMWAAYLVGLANTLRASIIGIILASILGLLVGIGRLSTNWLVKRVSLVFIEIMQNTPLLVQLFFWFVLIRALPQQRPDTIIAIPPLSNDLGLQPLIYFSQRAAAFPGLEVFEPWRFWIVLILGLAVTAGIWYWASRQLPLPNWPLGLEFWSIVAGLAVILVGWNIPTPATQISIPFLQPNPAGSIFNYSGGFTISNNFQALLLGLVLYTAAFIAEVVRSGIQAVQRGQIEAATSLGLSRGQQLRMVILPQALRVIIPPLINQYLNLVKNSSLAIAVAYPDLFNISQTIGNQTGQNTQVIILVMGTYLAISLIVSVVLNEVNKRSQIKER